MCRLLPSFFLINLEDTRGRGWISKLITGVVVGRVGAGAVRAGGFDGDAERVVIRGDVHSNRNGFSDFRREEGEELLLDLLTEAFPLDYLIRLSFDEHHLGQHFIFR